MDDSRKNRIEIILQSITTLHTDAIVNAANEGLLAGGGVCGAIFSAAGYNDLQAACNKIGHCDTGKAVITDGFKLPAKYIIHTAGPIWHGGNQREEELLYSCYHETMKLAQAYNIHRIAFSLISAGIYGVPAAVAWKMAIQSVSDYQKEHPETDIDVIFAVLDENVLEQGQKYLHELL